MPIRRPVLVATDLSEAADEALRQADGLARHLGSPLQVCHVLPEIVRVRMLFPQLQQRDTDEMQTLAGTAWRSAAWRKRCSRAHPARCWWCGCATRDHAARRIGARYSISSCCWAWTHSTSRSAGWRRK